MELRTRIAVSGLLITSVATMGMTGVAAAQKKDVPDAKFERALYRLDRKCPENASTLFAEASVASRQLRKKGKYETPRYVVYKLNQHVRYKRHDSCRIDFDAYVSIGGL